MHKYEVMVEADENDGDYVHRFETATEEDIERLKKISDALKLKGGRWNNFWNVPGRPDREQVYEGLLTEDDLEWFSDMYLPWPNNGSGEPVHTVTQITFQPIGVKQVMFGG